VHRLRRPRYHHGPREGPQNWNTEAETFRKRGERDGGMSSQEPGSGLMSSAGLVRYFDSEDKKGIQIDPKSLVAFSVLLGVLVLLLNAFGA
jgi:preprotein translocase subunit Sec61beta